MKKILFLKLYRKGQPKNFNGSKIDAAKDGLNKILKFESIDRYIQSSFLREDIDCNLVFCFTSRRYEEVRLYFKKRKIDIIYFSDSCFFDQYRGTKNYKRYPICVFVNGPASAPFGDKFYREDLNSKRVKLFLPEINLKPWIKGYNVGREYALITHQNGPDFLNRSRENFYLESIQKCKNLGFPILFRGHPSSTYTSEYIKEIREMGCEVSNMSKHTSKNMYKDFLRSKVMICHGGKSSVKSIIYGIPSFVFDSPMTKMVDNRNFNDLLNPKFKNREPWINWLTYNHWFLNELSEGLPWKFMLNNGYFNI